MIVRVYFDNENGEVIQLNNMYNATTVERDVATFKSLSERNRATFDYTELSFSAYRQDFSSGRLIGVDVETKIPIFEYPNPENPDEPIVPEKPLSVEIEELKKDNVLIRLESAQSNAELFEMMLMMSGGMV